MKFKLRGQIYEASTIDRLTLGDLIRLEKETTDMGRPMKWSELRGILERVQAEFDLDPEYDLEGDDQFPWFLGMMIWSSRRNAGEAIPFGDAVDIPLGEIEVIADKVKKPTDHKSKAGGAVDPRKARPASGRGAAGRRAAAKPKGLPAASVTT